MSHSSRLRTIAGGGPPPPPRRAKAVAVGVVAAVVGGEEAQDAVGSEASVSSFDFSDEALGIAATERAQCVAELEREEVRRRGKRAAADASPVAVVDADVLADDDGGDYDEAEGRDDDVDQIVDAVGRFRTVPKTPRSAKKKTSVMHVLFEPTPDTVGFFNCRMHAFASKGHPLVVKAKSGTSNLLSHARNYHKEVYEALVKAHNDGDDVEQVFDALLAALPAPGHKDGTLDGLGFSVTKKSELLLSRQLALLVCIIANCLPFSLVDSPHFVTWMALLGAAYPSRRTLMKLLPVLYHRAVGSLVGQLKEASCMSLTFDAWTSLRGTKYLVVTVHAITPDWTMLSAPLDLIPMHHRAYGELMAVTILSRLHDHKLDDVLLVSTTSDGASNCRLAKSILTPGDEEPCFNHCMHLMVNDVIDGSDTKAPLDPVAAKDFAALAVAITFIRGSSNLRAELKAACKAHKCRELELVMENVTRWEGRHDAVYRVLQLRPALVYMRSKGSLQPMLEKGVAALSPDVFQAAYFERLAAYLPLLQQLVIVSKAAQSQAGPTLSCVPHFLCKLRLACTVQENDGRVTKQFKSAMTRAISSRLDVFVTVKVDDDERLVPNAIKAALLDPRHSAEAQAMLSSDELLASRDAIIADVLHLLPDRRAAAFATTMEAAWTSLLEELRTAPNGLDGPGVLTWWGSFVKTDAGGLHVNWARGARMLLAIPAGSSPSESAFSSTGETVTKKRTRLSDETLEMMTITRHHVRETTFNVNKMVTAVIEDAKAALAHNNELSSSSEEDEGLF
jgi:hypothetical protein